MSVKAESSPTPLQKLGWAALALFLAAVLAALWVAAHRRKEDRLAARLGQQEPPAPVAASGPRLKVGADRRLGGTDARSLPEYFVRWAKDHPGRDADVELDAAAPPTRQQEVMEAAAKSEVRVRFVMTDSGLARLVLRRGDRLRVESFTLHFPEEAENVCVLDAIGTPCVEFVRMKKGERRSWQELQLTFIDVEKDAFTMEVELKPGAPCFGRGVYRSLKRGLRIEFTGDRSLTVLDWDPVRPRMRVQIDGLGQSREIEFGEKGEQRVLTIYYRLLQASDKDFMLLVDDLD